MDFEVVGTYDESRDRSSIAVTSPLQSDRGGDFEVFLGDSFSDPLKSFLGEEWYSSGISSWLKVASWLSGEIAAWHYLNRNQGLYQELVEMTGPYRDRDSALAEFNDRKKSASDPKISLRQRLRLLELAALCKERELQPASREQATAYIEGIGRIAELYGQFDQFGYLPPSNDAEADELQVEFVTSYGAILVSFDDGFRLSLSPAGSKGTKSILVPGHGLVRLRAGFLLQEGILTPEYCAHTRVGKFRRASELSDDLLRDLAAEISSEFLESRPDVAVRLGAAYDAHCKAIEWAKEVLPARLELWLRTEALQSVEGRAIPVAVGRVQSWVSPKIDAGGYVVRFRDPSARRTYGSRYDDYTGHVVDLGDGQLGVCHWHIDGESMRSRSYSPENADTDRLRALAIEAVRTVIESGHPSPLDNGSFDDFSVWAAHDFNFWTANHIKKNLELLGLSNEIADIYQRMRSVSLTELFHRPAAAGR